MSNDFFVDDLIPPEPIPPDVWTSAYNIADDSIITGSIRVNDNNTPLKSGKPPED